MLNTFVALDLEATGLNEKNDRIIEVGAVRFQNGAVCAEYHSLIQPQRMLEERIIELTGIRNEDLQNAPLFSEIAEQLREFLGNDPLVGHRIRGDVAMLKRAFAMQKILFSVAAIDTLTWSRKLLPTLESRQLGALCAHYRIPIKAHRALEDARANGYLYLKMCEEFPQMDQAEATCVLVNIKRDTPATGAQREQIQRLSKQMTEKGLIDEERRFVCPDGQIRVLPGSAECKALTRSEASRLVEYLFQVLRTK